MNLTPEQKEQGKRNFLRAIAAPPAVAAVRSLVAMAEPFRSRPVRVGFVGVGAQGRVLLGRSDPAYADVRAMADINPAQLAAADEVLAKAGRPAATHYAEWKEMLEKEDLEAVILGVPLWMHAEVTAGALEAGKHVLCEKMMAWDEAGCDQMAATAEKAGRVLEVGYQRFYNPTYVAAYHGVIRAGLLGDVYHARLAWHRNGNWRRKVNPPSPEYDPSQWGYPTVEHLINWRLYWKYSKGLFAELGSHQIGVVNWFFDGEPLRVAGTSGVLRFDDGREVPDHVYATWEYPGGRTVSFSSIESNRYDGTYEAFFGTKGTLVMSGEREAYLFPEGAGVDPGAADVTPPLPDSPEGRAASSIGWVDADPPEPGGQRITSSRLEISTFCSAIRQGAALACGPARAIRSARACLRANESSLKKEPLPV